MTFSSFHPMISGVYFLVLFIMTFNFNHPILVLISCVCSYLYFMKLYGKKGLLLTLIVIILLILFFDYYVRFNHFGITNLRVNGIGNYITLESIVYALILCLMMASLIFWISCFLKVFSLDKIVYLIGNLLPKLSLYLVITVRLIPRVINKFNEVCNAQMFIGKGLNQGRLDQRFINLYRITSIVLTWMIDAIMQFYQSMLSRGYSLKGRTSFSIYRFDNRDRLFVQIMFMFISIFVGGHLLNQTTVLYNPQIIFNKVTVLSIIFYVSYLIFGLLPIIIEGFYAKRFNATNIKIQGEQ